MRNNTIIKSILSASLIAAVTSLVSGCSGGGAGGGGADGGADSGGGNATKPTADTYFPLTAGSWWRYEEAEAAAGPPKKSYLEFRALRPDEYPKKMPTGIDKDKVYVLQVSSLPDPAAGAWDTAPTKMATGPATYAYYVVNDGVVALLQAEDERLDPPRPIVPLRPRPGQSWEYGGMTQRVVSARLTEERGTQQVKVKADNDASNVIWTFQKGTGLVRKDWQQEGSLGFRVLKDSYIAPGN